MRSSVPSQLQSSKSSYTVERGGRSLGIARHWQPVLRHPISPLTTSRTLTVRLLPPRLPGRMSGSTWLHSSSGKSLGYRSLLRSYPARFSIVHIGDLSTTQAAALASQTLDPIQEVPEQALRVAERVEAELPEERSSFIDGGPADWQALPVPEGRIVVGLDGGYVRDWVERKRNFEIIVGRSLPEDRAARELGLVHGYDRKPKRRLVEVLTS